MGASILNVDLYNCTGDTLGNISGCTGTTMDNYTVMPGYTNIPKRDFPKYVTVPTGTHFIKVKCTNINDGGCDLGLIDPVKLQMPTTPTPTPTTTPTAVPTATPTNSPTPVPTNTNTPTPTPTPSPEPATYTPTPSPEPATYTPTPTPTRTNTPTPTPTAEPVNTNLYYYYLLGDCREMGYTTQQITNTGFGIIRITGLCSSNITNMLSDPAHISYYTDYTNPCGFASGYTYSVYGKSLKSNGHIPEGSVFTIGDQCLSVVWIDEASLPGAISLISLDGLTPEPGNNPCYTCQPPFTGVTFNWYVYGATKCGTTDHILVYSIFPYTYDATPYAPDNITGLPKLSSLQTGLTYSMVTYNSSGDVVDDGYCATITSYYGAFTGQTVQVPLLPLTNPVTYKNLPVGVQAVEGHYSSDCPSCTPLYYANTAQKCGSIYELSDDPIWSTVKLNEGDIIQDNNGDCRRVLYPGLYRDVKYEGYWQSQFHTGIISMVGNVGDCTCAPLPPTPTPSPTPTVTPTPGGPPTILSFDDGIQTNGPCFNDNNVYEEGHFPSVTFASASTVNGSVKFTYNDSSTSYKSFYIGNTGVSDDSFTCGCVDSCKNLTSVVVV